MRKELILEIIQERWSPYSFSSSIVEEYKLKAMFEAAGYAPSCNNEQPWIFVYTTSRSRMSLMIILVLWQIQTKSGQKMRMRFLSVWPGQSSPIMANQTVMLFMIQVWQFPIFYSGPCNGYLCSSDGRVFSRKG